MHRFHRTRRVLTITAVAGIVAGWSITAPPATRAQDVVPSERADDLTAVVNGVLGLKASTLQPVTVEELAGGAARAVIDVAGERLTLDLEPHSVRAGVYRVLVQGRDGSLQPVEPAAVRTLRGVVVEIPGATVTGGLLDDGLYAVVRLPDGERWWVEPIGGRIAAAPAGLHVVYHELDVLPTGASCGAEALQAMGGPQPNDGGPQGAPPTAAGNPPICVAQLACDADFEYFEDYGSSVQQVEDRINLVINTMNEQYESDVGIRHEITTIIVRTSEPDPYSTSDPGALLGQFQNHWETSQGDIQRDVAQLFTGKNLSGSVIGIAYLSGLCSSLGYSVVQSDFSGNFSCVTDLSAHELGHNWSAGHCTCSNYTMNASITCSNTFHPSFTIPGIEGYRDSLSCLECLGTLVWTFPEGTPQQVSPDGGSTVPVVVEPALEEPEPGTGMLHYSVDGGSFTSLPMTETAPNEYDAVFPAIPCESIVAYYFSAETTGGETSTSPLDAPDQTYGAVSAVELVISFSDDFETDQGWEILDEASDGQWERRDPVPLEVCDRGNPGSDADGSGFCYVTDDDTIVCNSDVDNGTTTLTSPVMDASGEGDVLITYYRWFDDSLGETPFTEVFTVEVSDDGGASWTTLEIVGPGGPEAAGGWIFKQFDLAATGIEPTDQFRIRFIAQDLDDPSIVEAGVDGVQLQRILCDTTACPWDLDGDGMVGITDFLDLLSQWGEDPGGPPDFDGDGTVGITDFLELLSHWGACP